MVYIGFSFKNWMYWEQIQGFKIIIAKINDKKPLPDEKKNNPILYKVQGWTR